MKDDELKQLKSQLPTASQLPDMKKLELNTIKPISTWGKTASLSFTKYTKYSKFEL